MKNTKADRRSRRTRQLISAAFIELMHHKRYDEITVQDIIDRANVGRSTFYAHYLDKDDLLSSDFMRVLDDLKEHTRQPATREQPPSLLPFFEHVQANQQLYKALTRGGGIELLYTQGHQRLRRTIEHHLTELLPTETTPPVPLALVADYLAGTTLHLVKWWLDHNLPYTPMQLDMIFQQLVVPGVQATLHLTIIPATSSNHGA